MNKKPGFAFPIIDSDGYAVVRTIRYMALWRSFTTLDWMISLYYTPDNYYRLRFRTLGERDKFAARYQHEVYETFSEYCSISEPLDTPQDKVEPTARWDGYEKY